MIPPKGEWHRFSDDNEKLDYLHKVKLIPRTKGLRPIFYTGAYRGKNPVCDVVGYDEKQALVIEIEGQLHCVNLDYLLEMQSFAVADEYKIEYLSNPKASPTSFVVFDFETTDRNHRAAEIVEIGAVKYENGHQVDTYEQLVCYDGQMSFYARNVNKITDDMLCNQPSIEEVLLKFIDFIGDLPLVAFNGATYDFKIMERKCSELKLPFSATGYDAFQVAKKVLKCPAGNSLDEMREYYGLGDKGHRALEDAKVTAQIWEMCFPAQFVGSAPANVPAEKKKGPAQWNETMMIHNDIMNSLISSGLNYDLGVIQSENRPQKNGETEAILIMGNTVCVVKGKRKKDVSFAVRYQKILDSVGAQYRQLADGLRITPLELSALIGSTELAQLLYEVCLSDADSFSCCADYEKCSDAKKCIQTDPMFYGRCHYRENLKAGKIFYGKNKTV